MDARQLGFATNIQVVLACIRLPRITPDLAEYFVELCYEVEL